MSSFAALRRFAGLHLSSSATLVSQPRRLMAVEVKKNKVTKVLVANRGEIAIRVMRSCKKLGLKTVAVYSEADANAMHVRYADEKYCIGPALSVLSYLNFDRYVEAIKATGADAVHPGYGFLSEKHKFVEMLEKMGVTFIGPSSHAMALMGDKKSSKQVGTKAKINIIPGFDELVRDEEHCLDLANRVGYPVMVKAVGGGGGKGMRIAWNDEEAREGYKLAKAECAAAFNDDRLIVEKYIDNPRHIEIQVLADSHGNAIYLNERECSVQRRNQKVVEEAPSSFLDPATRAAMGNQAVSLCKTVGYQSAGTVEFLVDSKKNFYFLEMNTRLQVEHPVTEYITGVDIVDEMLRVAQGLPLSVTQDQIGIKGWSFESRIYAEDPYKWLPSPGRLLKYIEPPLSHDVRCDSGVTEGSDIQVYYDPLICKLVAYGKDRKDALDRLVHSLDMFVVRGPQNNIPLLRDILTHPKFQSGDISTKFMPQVYPKGFLGVKLTDDERYIPIATAAMIYKTQQQENAKFSNQRQLFFRDAAPNNFVLFVDGKKHSVSLTDSEDGKSVQVVLSHGTTTFTKNFLKTHIDWSIGQPIFKAKVNDNDVIMQVYSDLDQTYKIEYKGAMVNVVVKSEIEDKLSVHLPTTNKHETTTTIPSPMAGKLVSINIRRGDHVKAGDHIAVLEAMKMQNTLASPRSGIVKAVYFAANSYLKQRDVIVEFFENDSDYKPLHLSGSSPAAKLFLQDQKVSFDETPSTSTSSSLVSLEEGDFKVSHEQVVLEYLSRKFAITKNTPEKDAFDSMIIAEALAPFEASWLGRLESLLQKSSFLTSNDFTPADAAVYVKLKANSSSLDSSKFPKVAAFVAAIDARQQAK